MPLFSQGMGGQAGLRSPYQQQGSFHSAPHTAPTASNGHGSNGSNGYPPYGGPMGSPYASQQQQQQQMQRGNSNLSSDPFDF